MIYSEYIYIYMYILSLFENLFFSVLFLFDDIFFGMRISDTHDVRVIKINHLKGLNAPIVDVV